MGATLADASDLRPSGNAPSCSGALRMIAFQVSDMTSSRCAGAVTRAVKAIDHAARVHVDLATLTIEIEPHNATARQLSDAIKRAGYSPVAA
mgnify:CR=1 FL=1